MRASPDGIVTIAEPAAAISACAKSASALRRDRHIEHHDGALAKRVRLLRDLSLSPSPASSRNRRRRLFPARRWRDPGAWPGRATPRGRSSLAAPTPAIRRSASVRPSARGKPGMPATGSKYSSAPSSRASNGDAGGHRLVAERRARAQAQAREGRNRQPRRQFGEAGARRRRRSRRDPTARASANSSAAARLAATIRIGGSTPSSRDRAAARRAALEGETMGMTVVGKLFGNEKGPAQSYVNRKIEAGSFCFASSRSTPSTINSCGVRRRCSIATPPSRIGARRLRGRARSSRSCSVFPPMRRWYATASPTRSSKTISHPGCRRAGRRRRWSMRSCGRRPDVVHVNGLIFPALVGALRRALAATCRHRRAASRR